MSNKKKVDRIDVFAELTRPNGTFDYRSCEKLLGDNYDSFIGFCDAIKLIPEVITHVSVVSFPTEGAAQNHVQFVIETEDGNTISLEK